MIENKELGLKIAENPREKLIEETIENSKTRILHMELMLDLERNNLKFLEHEKKK